MKKIITWLTIFVLIFMSLPEDVSAAVSVVEVGKLGQKLSYKIYSDGLLEVTGQGATYDFGAEPHPDSPFAYSGDKITSIKLPEGLTVVGDFAFYGLENVKGTLSLPSTVTKIKYCAFSDCGFEKVLFSKTVAHLGYLAFGYNHNLTEINIPKNLKTIDDSAFDGCEKLRTVTSKSAGKYFTVVDDVIYSKDLRTLVYYPSGKKDTTYTIPNGVTEIRSMRNTCLTEIKLPEGLMIIGNGAFCWNSKLNKINIPTTVKSIGERAFLNCYALTELDIPQNCTLIGAGAFLDIIALENVYIRNKNCKIFFNNAPRTTVFWGYRNSTAYTHADRYGYEFKDIITGNTLLKRKGNQDFFALLPIDGLSAEVPIQGGGEYTDSSTGELEGYDFYIDIGFKKADAAIKKSIKEKTKELCGNLSTNYEKAKAIFQFVNQHMTYAFHSYNLSGAWKYGQGNCESYAVLTATMLYYAGIPNIYAYTPNHVFNVALCESRWVPIDSQGLFDCSLEQYSDINLLVLYSKGLVYVINDFTGVKLAQVDLVYGKNKTGINIRKNGLEVPEWVTGYYTNWTWNYPLIPIKGKKGSAAEKMAKELGYKVFVYNGEHFMAVLKRPNKSYITKTIAERKKITIKYKKVSKADGYQIRIATKKNMKKGMKLCTVRGSKTKYSVKKLKANKKYWIQVRTFKKISGEKVYSKWSSKKLVKTKK